MPGLPVLIFLLLIAVAGAVIVIWWMVRRSSENAIAAVSQTITNSRVTSIHSSVFKSRWADAVVGVDGLEPFLSGHNLILYGADSSGRSILVARAVDAVNSRFTSVRHAAVYVDMCGIIALSNPRPWLSVEVLYHHLLAAPLVWYHGLARPGSRDSRRRRLEVHFETLLTRPLNEIDAIGVRSAFEDWLDELRIQKLSVFLDYFSALSSELAPQLLHLLSRTYPRGGRVALVLGGARDELVIERLMEGRRIGLQINHDIQVGLDLDQLLRSPDVRSSRADPRQMFLLACLASLAPRYAGLVDAGSQPAWEAVFDPPEVWFELFRASDFDVEQVGAALADLLPSVAGDGGHTIDRDMIQNAVSRVRTRAQLQ